MSSTTSPSQSSSSPCIFQMYVMSLLDKSLRSFKRIIYSPFLVVVVILCLLFGYKYLYMNTMQSAFRRAKRKFTNCNLKSDQNLHLKDDPYSELDDDAAAERSELQCHEPSVSVYCIQGHRQYMEDRYDIAKVAAAELQLKLYAVYDGHGGSFASSFARRTLFKRVEIRAMAATVVAANLSSTEPLNLDKILSEEILAMDKQLLTIQTAQLDLSGSTVLVAAIHNSTLTIANVGDSRAVLCSGAGRAVVMSFDHKPDNPLERRRIEDSGGFIAFAGVWRVGGILATSRAIGDYPLKQDNMLIAEPELTHYDLGSEGGGCKFIILATDGLWDVFSDTDAIDYIADIHATRISHHRVAAEDDDHGAKELTIEAFRRGSMDNISVMVIMVQGHL